MNDDHLDLASAIVSDAMRSMAGLSDFEAADVMGAVAYFLLALQADIIGADRSLMWCVELADIIQAAAPPSHLKLVKT